MENNYWQKRCEAAETLIHFCASIIPDCPEYMNWQSAIEPSLAAAPVKGVEEILNGFIKNSKNDISIFNTKNYILFEDAVKAFKEYASQFRKDPIPPTGAETQEGEKCIVCNKGNTELYECEKCGEKYCDNCGAEYNQFTQIDYNCCKKCAERNYE